MAEVMIEQFQAVSKGGAVSYVRPTYEEALADGERNMRGEPYWHSFKVEKWYSLSLESIARDHGLKIVGRVEP